MTSNIVLSEIDYEVVGKRPVRPDGVDKVTGRAQYGADLKLPGLAFGKILRSPHAHASIISIDTSVAEKLPGVLAVMTYSDMPFAAVSKSEWSDDKQMGEPGSPIMRLGADYSKLVLQSEHIMANDKVLFKGHPVAAVCAVDMAIAEQAISMIEVKYQILDAVMDVREAMKTSAPILHETMRTNKFGEIGDLPSNIMSVGRVACGDIKLGFEESDIVIEREFTTASVHQGYIEPHNATAFWNNDQLNLWCSTQGSFVVRNAVSEILRHPISKIKVTPMEIGGGFGGKIPIYLEPIAAILSKKSGRPVKILMSRPEVFESTGPAPGTWMKAKIGANKDGILKSAEIELAYEAGAYPGSPVMGGAACALACYSIPNAQVDGYDVVVNKPKTAAYRAPGSPQAAFAVEQIIDELSIELGIDPIEFRLINAAKEGLRRVDGPLYKKVGHIECLEAAKQHDHYKSKINGKYRGRGVASGFWFNRGFPSSCNITVNSDGTINLTEGSVDIGGSRASISQQAAEFLGIAYEDVKAAVVDTDSIGYTQLTGGSRTTFATGIAAIEASKSVITQLIERAGIIWDKPIEEIEYINGSLVHKTDPELKLTFKEIASQLLGTGGAITGSASTDPPGEGNSFATHVVDVEIDPETGKVEIIRYTAVQDAGKAVHPSYVEGQIQGGVAQGIGWALNEEYCFDHSGKMMNSSFLDYRMPTSLDLPFIDTVIVEVANPGHPYGVRGVGETPIVPPLAAIANAVSNAIGTRIYKLPINPGTVLDNIKCN